MKAYKKLKIITATGDFRKITLTIIGSLIFSFGFKWFLFDAGLYSVDITGIVQILGNLFEQGGLPFNYTLVFYIASIPIFIFAYINFGARYTFYSMISVIIFGLAMLLPTPNKVSAEFIQFAQFERVIYGGITMGVGIGLCLKEGTSAGGFDVLFTKWSRSGKVSFQTLNITSNFIIVMIILGINDWHLTAGIHTIVRVIVTTVSIKFTNTSYNFVKLQVYSSKLNELSKVITHEFGRGATIFDKVGAYTGVKGKTLTTIIVRQELRIMRKKMMLIDPEAIIIASRIESVRGSIVKVREVSDYVKKEK